MKKYSYYQSCQTFNDYIKTNLCSTGDDLIKNICNKLNYLLSNSAMPTSLNQEQEKSIEQNSSAESPKD